MAADIVVLLVLIVLNGFFSLSEMAVVSSRRQRLQALLSRKREQGSANTQGVETALQLHAEPGRFLSAVQVGITLIGVFAGAFGGATLAEPLAATMSDVPMIGEYAGPAAFALVVIVITYLSLIVGELVPKQIALSNPEAFASAIARPMTVFARALSPIVTLLSKSSDALLGLYGVNGRDTSGVTEEEIKHLVEEGVATGAIETVERDIMNRVFGLGDLRVGDMMTPRVSMIWLDTELPYEKNLELVREHQELRYGVRKGENGPPVGMARMEDLFIDFNAGTNEALFANMSPPLYIPRRASVLKALSILQAESKFMAFIIDEYGEVVGTISMRDIFTAIVGDISGHAVHDNNAVVKRVDGSYLIDGVVSAEEAKRVLKLKKLPGDESSDVNTLAGVMFDWFGRLPREGDYFAWNGYRFEVADMDGPRVDKILVVPAQNLPIGAFRDNRQAEAVATAAEKAAEKATGTAGKEVAEKPETGEGDQTEAEIVPFRKNPGGN
jgi:putative hemolysin